jgi:hypothetical protein
VPAAPATDVRDAATYNNSTGHQATKRRRANKRNTKAQQPPKARRGNTKQQSTPVPQPPTPAHFATATAEEALFAISEGFLPLEHFALHGNAFNPDTNQIAEYRELIGCSEGALWIDSCRDEIGRLCQGLGPDKPTGTVPCSSFAVKTCPVAAEQRTCASCAHFDPKKKILAAFDSLAAATKSITLATSQPRHVIYPPSKYYSIACSLHRLESLW